MKTQNETPMKREKRKTHFSKIRVLFRQIHPLPNEYLRNSCE